MDVQTKIKAKELYVETGLSFHSILEILEGKVSRKTLYNWKNKEDWDSLRRAKVATKSTIREQAEKLLLRSLNEADVNFTPNNIFAAGKLAALLKSLSYAELSDDKKDFENEKTKGITQETLDKLEKLMGG